MANHRLTWRSSGTGKSYTFVLPLSFGVRFFGRFGARRVGFTSALLSKKCGADREFKPTALRGITQVSTMRLKKWVYYLSKITLIDEVLGFVYWVLAIYGIFFLAD